MASPFYRFGLWSLSIILLAGCAEFNGPPARADVLLVIVDTLRADALGCYGGDPRVSPNLDAFATDSVRFAECLAQAPNTATSHATLFTGLYPWSHRVANLTSLERGTPGLPPVFETLAERFQSGGFQTAAFTDGGPLGRIWNLCQGFEVLEASYEGVEAKINQALAWLDTGRDDRPLFLLVHTYQVHLPYAAPEAWVKRFTEDYEGPLSSALEDIRAERARGGESQPDGKRLLRDRATFVERDWQHLRALYRAEVAFTDHELQRLLVETEAGGALANATVAITSDHGEEFGEHGDFGHHQLHRETLHVPLLLRLPGGEASGQVVDRAVGLIDLFATLLDLAGLEPAQHTASRSLMPLLRGGRHAELPLFAETTEHLYSDRVIPWLRAVRMGDSVYLSDLAQPAQPASDRVRMFDRRADPNELEDLLSSDASASRRGTQTDQVRQLLERHLSDAIALRLDLLDGRPAAYVLPPDDELERELRALGYTGDKSE